MDSIEREKAGIDYCCTDADRATLRELFKEINAYAGTAIQYLAEIDALNLYGSGQIIARYITKLSSESVKSILIPQLVSDKVKDCDKLLLQLYLHFKASDEYISMPGFPAPAHIYVRYDNAFKALKPKRLKDDLIKLAHNPRDAFYLPFTMRMLASWKVPELKELLILYSSNSNITAQDVGIGENCDAFLPPLAFIKRELRFIAIDGLKYYPSDNISEVIRQYITDSDPDIRAAAQRTLKVLSK